MRAKWCNCNVYKLVAAKYHWSIVQEWTLRKHHLNLRLQLNLEARVFEHVQIVVSQPIKQQKKCWYFWNQTMWDWDTSKWMLWWVASWQNKWKKRRWKGGKRVAYKVAKGWQWLSRWPLTSPSKLQNLQTMWYIIRFSPFYAFLNKYIKNERKND